MGLYLCGDGATAVSLWCRMGLQLYLCGAGWGYSYISVVMGLQLYLCGDGATAILPRTLIVICSSCFPRFIGSCVGHVYFTVLYFAVTETIHNYTIVIPLIASAS